MTSFTLPKLNLLSMDKRIFSISLALIRLGVPPPINIVSNFHLEVSVEHCSISLQIALINLGIKLSLSVIE